MNIRVASFMFFFLLLMAPSAWASNYAQPVSGEVDGNIISFSQEDYVVMNGRILVPPEQVFSLLDAKYTWDGKTKTITAVRGSRKIVLTAGKARANVNGTIRKAMPSVQLIQSRPMVPLRLVSEALGGKVEWYPDTRTAIIDTKPKQLGIIEKKLIALAAEGKVRGFDFILGTPRQSIEKKWGKPAASDYFEGGQFFQYANCHCALLYNEKGQLSMIWLAHKKIGTVRTADVRKILGKPTWEDDSGTHEGLYYLQYRAGKNAITFHASSKHGTINSLWLSDKPWE